MNNNNDLFTTANSEIVARYITQNNFNITLLINEFGSLERLNLFLDDVITKLSTRQSNFDSLAVLNRQYSVNKSELLNLQYKIMQNFKEYINLNAEVDILNKKIQQEAVLQQEINRAFNF